VSSRPVAMANLIVARTASMFGFHFSGSDGAFLPQVEEVGLFRCLYVPPLVFSARTSRTSEKEMFDGFPCLFTCVLI
jgi:hypothetical protein